MRRQPWGWGWGRGYAWETAWGEPGARGVHSGRESGRGQPRPRRPWEWARAGARGPRLGPWERARGRGQAPALAPAGARERGAGGVTGRSCPGRAGRRLAGRQAAVAAGSWWLRSAGAGVGDPKAAEGAKGGGRAAGERCAAVQHACRQDRCSLPGHTGSFTGSQPRKATPSSDQRPSCSCSLAYPACEVAGGRQALCPGRGGDGGGSRDGVCLRGSRGNTNMCAGVCAELLSGCGSPWR